MTSETIAISLEDVANLRRMHRQQFKRLIAAQEAGDGPGAGRALNDLVQAHVACADLFDALECVLSTWTPPDTGAM